jgi:hypothetical protein
MLKQYIILLPFGQWVVYRYIAYLKKNIYILVYYYIGTMGSL